MRRLGRFIGAVARSFGPAAHGLRLLARQRNSKVHATLTAACVVLGMTLQLPRTDWLALLLAFGLVWAAEGFNTALEEALDALHPARHPGVGRAKDLAAGAVLAASVAAAAVGLVVFVPPLWELAGRWRASSGS